tara:strand:+ start:244 stop:546 length:303 start_codon:yes stop_codon:yes gene_type:complete
MAQIISRYGGIRNLPAAIYYAVENGTINFKTVIADGRRLDHYAQEHYGEGLNYWIIAAASGIRWPLGIGSGTANKDAGIEKSTVLFIPDIADVIRLKNGN